MILDNKKFVLDPNLVQVSKKGHEFKVIGLEKDPDRKPKGWGYNLQYCWIVNVRFIESGAIVAYYFDHNENFVKRKLINKGYQDPTQTK